MLFHHDVHLAVSLKAMGPIDSSLTELSLTETSKTVRKNESFLFTG
jgi:hypothetical protein